MSDRDPRLHVCLGVPCNNNCLFCMEADTEREDKDLRDLSFSMLIGHEGREREPRTKPPLSRDRAVEQLREYAGRGSVVFTGGEPTLHPDLVFLVAEARRLGYRQIGLVTNGRRLAYEAYAASLAQAGLNQLLVSVHGHTPLLHDGLTRTPGSFSHSIRGLENMRRLRARGGSLHLGITSVLNKRNGPHVAEMVKFFSGFGPDELVFNFVQPLGRGTQFFDRLVPRMSQAVQWFLEAVPVLERMAFPVKLLDVPLCVTQPLPPRFVGFVEAHEHEEGELRLMGSMKAELETGEERTLVTRDRTDEMLKWHGPICRTCAVVSQCPGLWGAYAARYGFEECQPLRPNELDVSHGK